MNMTFKNRIGKYLHTQSQIMHPITISGVKNVCEQVSKWKSIDEYVYIFGRNIRKILYFYTRKAYKRAKIISIACSSIRRK